MTTRRARNALYLGVILLGAAVAVIAVALILSPTPERPPHEGAMCGDPAEPLLLVGDFNADGIVDEHDLAKIRQVVSEASYLALYDRNADGVVDGRDAAIVAGEREVHGYTTYNECQRYESATPGANAWRNIWMVHMWHLGQHPPLPRSLGADRGRIRRGSPDPAVLRPGAPLRSRRQPADAVLE